MRALAGLLAGLLLAFHVHASPALHGTWSALVNGEPTTVVFDANGSGKVNGQPMRWQAMGQMLFVEQGGQVATYQFEVQGGTLRVAGGDLDGVVAFTRGQPSKAARAAPAPAAAGNGQELVGKWCNMSTFAANRGGSQRTECFELRADGTYTYAYEGSMSGTTGSTASQAADAGRWRFDGQRLTAQSRSGKVASYALEKRNHPKNRRDPMICLDGTCYVTYYARPAW